MNKYKISILISCLICIIFIAILHLCLDNLNIISLLIISFSPLVISIIVSFIISRKVNLVKINPLINALIFSIGNLICSFVEWFLLYKNDSVVKNIIDSSQKYSSEYVQISQNGNPMASVIIIFVFSLCANYIIYKKNVSRIER